jgi:hypothetical protein
MERFAPDLPLAFSGIPTIPASGGKLVFAIAISLEMKRPPTRAALRCLAFSVQRDREP